MSALTELVENLEVKIATLLQRHHTVVNQNDEISSQLDKLKEENEQLVQRLRKAEEREMTLKTANALLGSNDYKRETKLKINALVREIDACIASLAE